MPEQQKPWSAAVAAAREEQLKLCGQVSLQDALEEAEIRTIAGVDVAFRDGGARTFAAVVVMEYPGCRLIQQAIGKVPTGFPYVPGYLSFRELPAILEAWKTLEVTPDIVLCDGQGIAHPRRFGIASHLGVVLDIPTIGVAKSRLVGQSEAPGNEKGQAQPLVHNGEQVGWVLRSRCGVKPLYISPGHRVSLDACCRIVINSCLKYRLPEPTRIADKLSKTRT